MSEPVISVNSTLGPTVEVLSDGGILVNVATPVSGTGDVTSSSTSLDNQITRFDGTSGKIIQNSGITIADGASGTLSGTNSGDVTIGTANGLSLAGQALSLGTASASTTGALTATDWQDFDSKQDAGNYITSLTGDVTASGPGSAAATLANTAVTPGAYTNANITVDSKGRITAAANGSGGATGTVTNVSVTTANGVSGTVANPTTTPAISLTLGAITPSSVTSVGSVTGSNLSGTNTGDVSLASSVTDVLAITGQSISGVDQGSDKLVFWDESANKLTALTAGSGLSISGTTITATATGDVVGPASSTDNALVRFDSTTGKLIQNGQITESDTGDLAAINSLAFDTTPTGSLTTQGQMMWNADEETLDLQLNSFAIHLGEHVVYHVKNSTGSTIAKGVPVMFAGTNGASGKLLVQPWNGTGPSTYFMGLTAEELSDTEEGFVISFGKLRGIQTNGGNYGETWADGEIIYVGTTSGSLTKTQPAAPNPHIQVCAVVNAHASNGTLFIRPTLGSNIKDDEGVTITSLSSGQLLVANNAGTVFENKSVSGDATLANTGALTLATVNSNVGSFGSATAAPAVTVNAKGLVTAVSTNTITPAVGSITGLGTGVATALAVNVGSAGAFSTTPGSTNVWIPASMWIPRTTTGCGVDSRETSSNRQNFDELLFDAGTDEFAQALVMMPNNYNAGTITARFYWTASTGSGAVVWGIQGRAYADDDALDSATGTAQTVTDTLLAVDDMHITSATSAVTLAGTPAANRPVQFQIYRDADAGGDTLANDARLLGVEILYTSL